MTRRTLYELMAANAMVGGLPGRKLGTEFRTHTPKKGFMASTETCKAKDCTREVIAKGYCRKHYRLWRAGEMPKARYKICTFEKCRKKRFRGSLCTEHYAAKTGKAAPGAAAPAAPAAPAPAAPAAQQSST